MPSASAETARWRWRRWTSRAFRRTTTPSSLPSHSVAALREGDRSAYTTKASEALDSFRSQRTLLSKLAATARPRARQTLADATNEIDQLLVEVQRQVAAAFGIAVAR